MSDDDSGTDLRSTQEADGDGSDARASSRATESLLRRREFSERYERLELLGRGGMGEVCLVRDRLLGRDVAMKTILSHRVDSPQRWRFLRESRVQAQLEHPAVVPVYDLGIDPEGHPYFTMRRVRGSAVAKIVAGLRAGAADLSESYPRRRLLRRFVQVCHAVGYIHSRGVIHRDLKPRNIMFGEYGEVHVLDWGLAKLLDVTRGADEAARIVDASFTATTGSGTVMGTPGYMSPEALRGHAGGVDARADVYSLGAVLFELLTLETLHPVSPMSARMLSSLQLDGSRPNERRPDLKIAAELDAICARATRLEPIHRFDSAEQLAEAVEAHLDA